MAENKRNGGVTGKVATPKTVTPTTPAAPPIVDTFEALGKSIGARIKLTTAAPHAQTYEGSLFTADPILNIVAINTRSASSTVSATAKAEPGDYHVIPVSRIQSFQVLSLPTATDSVLNFTSAQPAIGPVDVKRLEERERTKIGKLKEAEQHRGKGVTKEAQAIYDSFKRINMPIRWHNDQMIVADAVIIQAPYGVQDCSAPAVNQDMLNRVRKVLEGERRKLKQREDQERRAAKPVEPRKGG